PARPAAGEAAGPPAGAALVAAAEHAGPRLLLVVGDGGGDEDLVADDDGTRPGDAGHGRLPLDVLVGGPLAGQAAFGGDGAAAGPAELGPVAGAAQGDRAAHHHQAERPTKRHHTPPRKTGVVV